MHELCELRLVAFHQHCLLLPSRYFCFLLMFIKKKKKRRHQLFFILFYLMRPYF